LVRFLSAPTNRLASHGHRPGGRAKQPSFDLGFQIAISTFVEIVIAANAD